MSLIGGSAGIERPLHKNWNAKESHQNINTKPTMKEFSLMFSTDGTASCLWTEAVPLQELGKLEIRRASTVGFNILKQKWEVRLLSKPNVIAFSHPSRQRCLDWERNTLNALF